MASAPPLTSCADRLWRAGGGNAIDLGRDINRGNMILAMIFKFEDVGMSEEDGQRFGVAPQPAGGDEDRRRDLLIDQSAEDARIGLAHAGIKGQGNARCALASAIDVEMRLDELDV